MEDEDVKQVYKPPEEYEEDLKEPLIDISLNESTELWLIQWPYKQNPDFDGKELSLNLDGKGQLGSFEDSAGKSYDVVSFDSHESDATVFLTSSSQPKIAGKIARRISLVHYPEPKELEQLNSMRKPFSTSSGMTVSNSSHRFSTPTQSSRRKNPQSSRGYPTQTQSHSSKHKSSLSELGEPSRSEKRKRVHESTDRSTLDSLGGLSATTISGSSEHSHKGKSKKTKAED